MNRFFLIGFLIICVCTTAFICKKADFVEDPYFNPSHPASALVNGRPMSWATTLPTDVKGNKIEAAGSMFWTAVKDTLMIAAYKTIDNESVCLIMKAVVTKNKIGTYDLSWNDFNPYLVKGETYPLNCIYGSKNIYNEVFMPNATERIDAFNWIKKISAYSGIFNFSCDLGSGRVNTISNGKFSGIHYVNR